MLLDLIKAVVLGIVEGLTEFLPASSTGHLLLLEHFFGFDDDAFGKTFVVLIQLGAVLAILSVTSHLWTSRRRLSSQAPRLFTVGVLSFLSPRLVSRELHASSGLPQRRIVCICYVRRRRALWSTAAAQARPMTETIR